MNTRIKDKFKIGIFDSGLGGLIIAKAIKKALPQYDYVYLGDTQRVPYGNRSHETVYQFTKEGIDYLFKKENCLLVILACNTASARALRRIQQEYLPEINKTPSLFLPLTKGERARDKREAEGVNRNVLGVLIPTAEESAKFNRVAVIGTEGTIKSNTFIDEIAKVNKNTKVFQNPAPMLVPLAEAGDIIFVKEFIKKYLKPLLVKKPTALILGCTHYPFYKKQFKEILPSNITLLSQDEIIPKKLKDYLIRHPEIEKSLSKKGQTKILLTDVTKNITELSKKWFGIKTKPKLVKL